MIVNMKIKVHVRGNKIDCSYKWNGSIKCHIRNQNVRQIQNNFGTSRETNIGTYKSIFVYAALTAIT